MPTEAPVVLVVAGSDSSGGAGLAADLDVLLDEGCAVRLAVTAVTAQTPEGVTAIAPIPGDVLRAQLDAAGSVDAVKVGMLAGLEQVQTLIRWLATLDPRPPVVVDPVLRSSTGSSLLSDDGADALWELWPLVALATPNHAEAEVLSDGAGAEDWAGALPCPVLVTGGDREGDEVIDLFFDGEEEPAELAHPRVEGTRRGTGCRLSSHIAARMAHGEPVEDAVFGGIQAIVDWL